MLLFPDNKAEQIYCRLKTLRYLYSSTYIGKVTQTISAISLDDGYKTRPPVPPN
jgi:hypothetical protein